MPLPRCWNFEDNGSRKWKNGTEVQCRPNCAFIHPSDPDWDRAPVRGRGGAPHGGRGRGQSSFGPRASGANSSALGPDRGSSSGTWNDYMTGFNSNPRATSSGWGSSGADGPGWGGSGADGPGWGSSGADGPDWGSSTNNNANPSDGWLNEPGASGEQASSSQWGTHAAEWGSSGDGWGTAGTDPGPGWGETSNSNQGSKPSSATAVANSADPDALLGGTGADNNPDAATATTPSSWAVPSIPTLGELNSMHNEERGEDILEPTVSSAIKSIKLRPPLRDHDNYFISTLSDTEKMSFLVAMTLKKRELDAELLQLSALRKSRQVAATRAAKELLQGKVDDFTDAQVAVEAEHNMCSGKLTLSDSSCVSNVQHTLAALGRDNEQLEQFQDWVSRAETCLSHVRPESSSDSPIERSGATFVSKLNQLKGKSEALAETVWQCQGQQFYNTFLNNQIQDKKDSIVAAIVKSQDTTFNHLVLTSLVPLQRQEEVWHQTLQIQAENFAQALLQSDQLKEDKRNQFSFKQKEKSTIQQVDMVQKRLQLQVLQEEVAQLHHILTSMKQQQQSATIIDTLDEYASYVQDFIQSYIQASATLIIKAELSKALMQFTAAELKTVEKVWNTLQPFAQMLQHPDIYKTEEEMEIREIEESLLA